MLTEHFHETKQDMGYCKLKHLKSLYISRQKKLINLYSYDK